MKLPNRLGDYWDDIFGSNYNSTDYFENYILTEIESSIVIALDEVDIVFNHPEIATDFLGLLRAWYEKAKYGDISSRIWQKLRLIVVHSTEVYIPLNINQSPFNVGLSIELSEFNPQQVQDLACRYGSKCEKQLEDGGIISLMSLVGGNPYLIRLALYHIQHRNITLTEILETASTEQGIFSDHLRRQLWHLQQYSNLATLYKQVVMSLNPLEFESVQAFRLQSLGLAKIKNNQVIPSFDLYRQYFKHRLSN